MAVSADTLIGLAKKASKMQLIRIMVFFFIIDPQNNAERDLAVYSKYEIKLRW
jgi:cytochrome oxidase Cu insertion factor (SCO1/SenC/PrrC family)